MSALSPLSVSGAQSDTGSVFFVFKVQGITWFFAFMPEFSALSSL